MLSMQDFMNAMELKGILETFSNTTPTALNPQGGTHLIVSTAENVIP